MGQQHAQFFVRLYLIAGSYPVFYLLHGGGETNSSWSTVGRAGDILDNLIASGKVQPMIIVMPAGWTPFGPQVMTGDATKDPFNDEPIHDIIPYIESHYRPLADPEHRALGGLPMGGIQTLNIGLHNLGTFRSLVVMSSGWFPAHRDAFFNGPDAIRISQYNAQLKVFWWGGDRPILRAITLSPASPDSSKQAYTLKPKKPVTATNGRAGVSFFLK
ncbi:alpha/beta hydrolase [Granulicella arctica]|uniref:alpha/beta hydrolase n=1 Tax=Granulicella arctica TaxID=940613 RepID=UPI0021DFE913|nr:alpha/beta hydrolase-fold protein [Granulicella arctica]